MNEIERKELMKMARKKVAEVKKVVMVRVVDGLYRNQPVKGEFVLVDDVKQGKIGRRKNFEGDLWFITVALDTNKEEFSGWGHKRDKVRIIVPGPGVGYEIINGDNTNTETELTVSDMTTVLPDSVKSL